MQLERSLQNMDEVKVIIAQTVTASGGTSTWNTLLAAVPSNLQRHFIPALKALERDGTYARRVTATENGYTFAIVKL